MAEIKSSITCPTTDWFQKKMCQPRLAHAAAVIFGIILTAMTWTVEEGDTARVFFSGPRTGASGGDVLPAATALESSQ